MFLFERLLNVLLYLSLITADIICFVILCAIPVIIIGSLCLLFVRDKREKSFLISAFRMITFGTILREVMRKMFRKR